MDKREELEKAIRELVKVMYNDLQYGACGDATYEGDYEREIQALVDAIEKLGLNDE